MLATFANVAQASETVAAIIANRIVPATLEFLDNFTIRTVEDYSHAGLPVEAAALLLIEVDGHPAVVAEEAEKVEAICRQHGATEVHAAKDDAERDRVWSARRAALSALAKLKPTVVLEDATVPRSKIPAMIRAIEDDQPALRSAHRHLRPRRGRQSPPHHPDGPQKRGRSGTGWRPRWTPSLTRPWAWAGRSPANTASAPPSPVSWKKR